MLPGHRERIVEQGMPTLNDIWPGRRWSLESSAGNQAGGSELLLRTNGNEHFTRTDEAIRGFKLAQGARNFLPDRCSLLLVQPCQHLVQGSKRFTLEAHALVG